MFLIDDDSQKVQITRHKNPEVRRRFTAQNEEWIHDVPGDPCRFSRLSWQGWSGRTRTEKWAGGDRTKKTTRVASKTPPNSCRFFFLSPPGGDCLPGFHLTHHILFFFFRLRPRPRRRTSFARSLSVSTRIVRALRAGHSSHSRPLLA